MEKDEMKKKERNELLKGVSNRFDDIMFERNLKAKDLATLCNVTPSCMSGYINGESLPSIEALVKLSKSLNITTDYLCGLSENANPDIDNVAINRMTGLSHNAISVLKEYNSKPEYAEFLWIINFLLEQETPYLIKKLFENNPVDKKDKDYIELDNKIRKKDFNPIISTIHEYFTIPADGNISFNKELGPIKRVTTQSNILTKKNVPIEKIIDSAYLDDLKEKLKKAKQNYNSHFSIENDGQ